MTPLSFTGSCLSSAGPDLPESQLSRQGSGRPAASSSPQDSEASFTRVLTEVGPHETASAHPSSTCESGNSIGLAVTLGFLYVDLFFFTTLLIYF